MDVHCQAPGERLWKGVVLIMLPFLLNTFLDGKQVYLGTPFSTSWGPWSLTKWVSLNASQTQKCVWSALTLLT